MGTVEAAQGKWLGLLTHFGIDSKYLIKRHGPCPMCGGKDRFTWDNKHNLGTFLCNHCGAGTGFTLLCKFKGWTMAEAMQVSDIARQKGYGTVAESAMRHAMELQ
jgi:putative DNA primase/helicase